MPNLPKGPNSTFLNTYKVGTNPFEFYRECHREYGDPFTVPAMNGTVVCTGSPEGARQIFTTPTDHFLPFGAEALEPIAKHSIFLLSGSRHKEERKLLAPSFHGARMKLYAQDMSNAALSSVEGLEAGASFNVIDNFLKTAMEIILRTIFGVEEKSDIERLSEEVKLFSDAVSPSFIFFKMLQHEFGGIGPWSRFKAAEAKFNAIIYEIIAERRKHLIAASTS